MEHKGYIAEKPVPEIFRQIAAARSTGLLRLSSEQFTRAVVVEDGMPVYAVSNVPQDQLDVHLVRLRLLTPQQASDVKSRIEREHELPAKILELGLLTPDDLDSARRDQVARIIQSAMLWRDGEYLFDTSARVAHDISVEGSLEQWLLDAGHSVTPLLAREILDAAGERFTPHEVSLSSLQMSPLDGFLLSRITTPSTVDEIVSQSGLPEDQSVPAIYSLFASGLLVAESDAVAPAAAPPPVASGPTIEEVRVDLTRTLSFYSNADHYEVLGITRSASSADIKRAYYSLAKKYHPDRYHAESDAEVRENLEAVFAFVTRAYDTLSDARHRADYDREIGANPTASAPPPPPPTVATPMPAATPAPRPVPRPEQPAPAPRPPASPPPAQAPPPPLVEPEPTSEPAAAGFDPAQLAEQLFRQGSMRLEQRDVLGAIELLREAVRMAPSNGQYHLQLGLALAHNPRWLKEAEMHLLEAQKFEPRNVQVYLKLGEIYHTRGLPKRAESQYRAALNYDPLNRNARKALTDMGIEVPSLTGRRASAKESEKSGGLFSKLFKKK